MHCDMYYAEHQIMQALPDMIENAHDPQLKQRLLAHLGETINHIDRLEDVFSLYGADPRHLNCPAIDGIIQMQRACRSAGVRHGRSSRASDQSAGISAKQRHRST
jgi:ferritin-like metal-binding protein YciE